LFYLALPYIFLGKIKGKLASEQITITLTTDFAFLPQIPPFYYSRSEKLCGREDETERIKDCKSFNPTSIFIGCLRPPHF
jgi:hypothetical protein